MKQTRKELIKSLQASDITRQIDKMDLYSEWRIITLENARKATANSSYPVPSDTIHVKLYVTNGRGTYGYQFLACVWIHIDGDWYQASGSKTGGCGYDKVSTAIGSALRAVGIDNRIDGTGEHERFIQDLAAKLLPRKKWFMMR